MSLRFPYWTLTRNYYGLRQKKNLKRNEEKEKKPDWFEVDFQSFSNWQNQNIILGSCIALYICNVFENILTYIS